MKAASARKILLQRETPIPNGGISGVPEELYLFFGHEQVGRKI